MKTERKILEKWFVTFLLKNSLNIDRPTFARVVDSGRRVPSFVFLLLL